MKTILVPTDFSKNAHNACLYAIALAKKMKANILLMHVFDTPLIFADVPIVTTDMDYAVFREAAVKNLKKYFKRISTVTGNVKIELIIKSGLPSAKISEIALEKKVDLILMGTTGQGAIERMLIGSNTSRLIKDAPCMTLAIPPNAKYRDWEKIVYATDLSDDNLKHANVVAQFIKVFNAEMLFLHVTGLLDKMDDKKFTDGIIKKIKKQVRYSKTSCYLSSDVNAAEGINNFIKNHKADALVMYTHHRSVLKQIFNSSVTKSLSLHTITPILVMHETD